MHENGPRDRFAALEAVRGETYNQKLTWYQSDGTTPLDLTGETITLNLYKDGAAAALKTLTAGSGIAVDGKNGEMALYLSAGETAALEPIAYQYELWADNGAGERKLMLWGSFWVQGRWTI